MILRELIARFGVEVDPASVARVDQTMRQVGTRVQRGGRQVARSSESTGQSVEGLAQGFRNLGAAVAGSFVVRGIQQFVLNMSEAGEEIGNTSEALGLSASALAEWRFIADRGGVTAEQLTAGLAAFSRQVGAAASGNSVASANFRRLGVSLRDVNGNVRPTSELFEQVGLALAALPPGAQRSAAAMRLLGRSGALLLPAFADGAEGIERARATVRAFTGGELSDFVERSKQLNDRVDVFKLGLEAIKVSIFLAAAPAVEWLVTKITAGFRAFQEFTRGTQFVKVALVSLGAIMAVFGATSAVALLPFILMTAAALVLALAFDDVATFLRGGNSQLGLFLDRMLGVGRGAEIATALRDAWTKVADVFNTITTAVTATWSVFTGFTQGATSLTSVFTTLWDTMQAPIAALERLGAARNISHILGLADTRTGAEQGFKRETPGSSHVGAPQVLAPTTATIHISPQVNPEETGRAVQAAIVQHQETTAREAHGALVPRGA